MEERLDLRMMEPENRVERRHRHVAHVAYAIFVVGASNNVLVHRQHQLPEEFSKMASTYVNVVVDVLQ